ncbi:tRNA:m(4)X modification enzyme TRM13 [Amphibalanus amphitrite]|uniref:tRNA:m(4)X modification enzyme TRM13 n=1 Tax=Amphibalanus amphitrite TaxID=1232801 RepID=A0A6A4WPN1_AMPAM|nr:tRNA:m(4)X modification enzyme TRM13 [Amphibalanus amphitrite]
MRTCYLKKLQKHLKVCNAREKERPPYYVRDINAGDGSAEPGGPTIHELSDRALLELLDKISALHSEHVSPPEVAEEAAHEALSESLQNPAFGADTLKHLRQNSSLLAVMRDAGLLQRQDATFVDLGSGKAQLSFWLARAVSSRSQIVLVDFASHRHKAENKLKDVPGAPEVQRLKLDIRHLSLAGCEACRGRPVVTIGKHLCGAATDLGIRAATVLTPSDVHRTPAGVGQDGAAVSAGPQTGPAADQSGDQTRPQTGDQSGPPAADRTDESGEPTAADVRGIMIAVCCHHRVDWPSYVGKQFLQDVCGFSAADFAALKGVAAWATCGTPGWDAERPSNRRGQHEAPRKRRYKPAEPADKRPRLEGAAPGAGPAGQPGQGSSDQSESAPSDQSEWAPADQTESSATDQPRPEPASEPGAEPADQPGERSAVQPGPEPANGPGPEAADQPGGPGSRDASAGRYQRLGLSPERRTAVGFQCKRLLDEGRRRYLESRGFCARLVRYVPPAVSPENVLLLATR